MKGGRWGVRVREGVDECVNVMRGGEGSERG